MIDFEWPDACPHCLILPSLPYKHLIPFESPISLPWLLMYADRESISLLGELVWKLEHRSFDDRMGLVHPDEMMWLWTAEEYLEWDRLRQAWCGDIVLSGGSRQNESKTHCVWHTSVEIIPVLHEKRLKGTWL